MTSTHTHTPEPPPCAAAEHAPPTSCLHTRMLEPGIVEVRMHRPTRLNALTPELIAALLQTFTGLQHDRHTRVVILTGEGKGFCAGADLQEVVHRARPAWASWALSTNTKSIWRS